MTTHPLEFLSQVRASVTLRDIRRKHGYRFLLQSLRDLLADEASTADKENKPLEALRFTRLRNGLDMVIDGDTVQPPVTGNQLGDK